MENLIKCAEKNSKIILDTERYIWKNPETGYKEYKTSAYLKEVFENLGYELVMAENIPGFYTTIDTGKPGPTLLILGEMDSVICPQHPESDPETGAVHSCGHNVQCAMLVGVAAALKEPNALDNICGKIKLCAVPAEELLEIEYRSKLKEKGIIKYFGGKSEFMYRGYFDDVDLAFMIHASSTFAVQLGSVGCLAKKITFKGKAAHAGGSPWNGINALYAANCGLNAINAIRETFAEKDIIRVHPIITSGGAMVNAIPETATLESYVRGATFEGIADANKKVNRALCGGALSLGANVDITDFPGYSPLVNDKNMIDVAIEAAAKALPNEKFIFMNNMNSASTDMGELCQVMPSVHPYIPGIAGKDHGADYYVVDPEKACVGGTKFQLAMLYILLSDNAKRAKKIISEFTPQFATKKEFFEFVDKFSNSGDRIDYSEDDFAKVNLK